MKHLRTLRGYRPLTFVPDGVLLAKGYDLYVASLDCSRLERVAAIPHTLAAGTLRQSRLIERILRLGIRFGCRIGEGDYLLAERNRLWLLDLQSGTVRLDHVIERGMKPLSIARIHGVNGFLDGVCFGEYWYNVSKEPVNIWVRNQQRRWRIAHTFPRGTIEHVHGMIPDERRGIIWILDRRFRGRGGNMGGAARLLRGASRARRQTGLLDAAGWPFRMSRSFMRPIVLWQSTPCVD